MAIRVGINGYGRIGRNVLRALYEGGQKGAIQIVAINDLGDANTNAHLTRFDTTLTKVIEGTLVKACAWYDNEWGFSNRMLDTTLAWSKAK